MTTTTDCYCTDEGPCEDHCTVLVQREGASHRTADELLVCYVKDCADLLGALTPVAADVLARVDANMEEHQSGWITDDIDLADELADLAWQHESVLGAWTVWDDGYVILEPTDDCPLVND